MAARSPTRVVVIEDSPTQRAFLRRSLEAEGDIVVVGEAGTAVSAVAAVARAEPDVVTVDLDIPGGGAAAIERILRTQPRPVLVLTGTPIARVSRTLVALGVPPSAVLVKPLRWDDDAQQALRRKVRSLRRAAGRAAAAGAPPPPVVASPRRRQAATESRNPFVGAGATGTTGTTTTSEPGRGGAPVAGAGRGIVAIAASTGGPSALVTVLSGLMGLDAPVLVVQHIGAATFAGLADWLARSSGWPVDVARDGDPLTPGRVVLGPPGTHLTVAEGPRVALVAKPVRTHMPSADELFSSLARVTPKETVGAILTGMGADGAAGLLSLRTAGGVTIAQDEASSVVFGMAKAAIELGAIRHTVPLDTVAPTILRVARGMW